MIKSITETEEEIILVFSNPIDMVAPNPLIISNDVFRKDLMKFISEKYNTVCDKIDISFHSFLDIQKVFVIDLKGQTKWEHQVELIMQKDNTVAVEETTPPALIKSETITKVVPDAEPKKTKATRRGRKRKAESA